MNEAKRYWIGGVVESKDNPTGKFVAAVDFDRVIAERDALQLRLNPADQRIDDLMKPARSEAEDALALIVDHQQFIASAYEDLIDKASDFQERAYALGIARGIVKSVASKTPQ